jgi:hypothetical protein
VVGIEGRPRYARRPTADREKDGATGVTGHRHGHRKNDIYVTCGELRILALSPMPAQRFGDKPALCCPNVTGKRAMTALKQRRASTDPPRYGERKEIADLVREIVGQIEDGETFTCGSRMNRDHEEILIS